MLLRMAHAIANAIANDLISDSNLACSMLLRVAHAMANAIANDLINSVAAWAYARAFVQLHGQRS